MALLVQGLLGAAGDKRVIKSLFINNKFELEQGSEEIPKNVFGGFLEGFLE